MRKIIGSHAACCCHVPMLLGMPRGVCARCRLACSAHKFDCPDRSHHTKCQITPHQMSNHPAHGLAFTSPLPVPSNNAVICRSCDVPRVGPASGGQPAAENLQTGDPNLWVRWRLRPSCCCHSDYDNRTAPLSSASHHLAAATLVDP